MKFFILFLALYPVFTGTVLADSKGYQIKVKINNLPNDTVYLAYHFGDKQYMKDTTKLDTKGMGVFEGKEPLPGGFYLLVFPKKNYLEFIVNEQAFSIETDTVDYQKNFKSTGSVENKVLHEDITFMTQKQKERSVLEDEYKKAESDKAKQDEIKARMKSLDDEVKAHRDKIQKDYASTFYAKFLRSLDEPQIPECPKNPAGECIDSMFDYHYYKAHYFDNIDLTDDRMLRTPIFHRKVMEFVEKIVPPAPDSISYYCGQILEKARPNKEVFKYWLITLLNAYANSKIMCQEAVYVYLVENYYAKGDAPWVSEEDLQRIIDRAKKWKPTLCGKVAPNMYLRDTSNNLVQLHLIKAKYMMLYFYDPDCGHCKKETPLMVKAYRKITDSLHVDFKVLAAPTMHLHKGDYDENKNPIFSTDPNDRAEWTNFIRDYDLLYWINAADLYLQDNFRMNYDINSTPTVLLLDADKKIIAKKFNEEQLIRIIEDLEKRGKKAN